MPKRGLSALSALESSMLRQRNVARGSASAKTGKARATGNSSKRRKSDSKPQSIKRPARRSSSKTKQRASKPRSKVAAPPKGKRGWIAKDTPADVRAWIKAPKKGRRKRRPLIALVEIKGAPPRQGGSAPRRLKDGKLAIPLALGNMDLNTARKVTAADLQIKLELQGFAGQAVRIVALGEVAPGKKRDGKRASKKAPRRARKA